MTDNQNPEQHARDSIDAQLRAAGWAVQAKNKVNFGAASGVAVREWQTDVGPADYVLFIDKQAVGVIEAKREEEGQHLTVHESQTEGYAAAKLKWVSNKAPLPFLYEATGAISLEEQLEIVQELESKLSEADQLVKQDKNDEPATALLECLRTAKSHGMKTSGKRGKSG